LKSPLVKGYPDVSLIRPPFSDHLPDLRSILPSAGSVPSLYYSLGIYDTAVHLDGAEREKCEEKVSKRVRMIPYLVKLLKK